MAIAFDAQSKSSIFTTGTSNSFAHTCTGTNLTLVVSISLNSGGNTVSGVTYNSVSMTQVQTARYHQSTAARMYTFILINPSTGSNNIAITTANSLTSNGDMQAGGNSYTGTLQSAQPDASNLQESATSDSSITQNVTVVASNCWGYGATFNVNATQSTNFYDPTGVLTTKRQAAGDDQIIIADSNGTIGTGSRAMGFSQNGGTNSCTGLVVLSIAPFPSSNTAGALLMTSLVI